MLAEADVVHVVGGRVADDVCQSSARVETSVREERSACLFVFVDYKS